MPSFRRGSAEIHFDDEGDPDGFPVFLIAPGGMKSANDFWNNMPWNPRTQLANDYRLIGMDQRNAGRSTAPVSGSDGWGVYREDQLALLDRLDIERCHLVGMCIGGPYIAGLLTHSPQRFASAVLLQPVGIDDDNRPAFHENFGVWSASLADAHPEASADDWVSFRGNMFDGEFVVTATRQEVAQIEVPLLVAMGNDLFHPQATSREIASLARDVTFVEHWKDEASLPAADAAFKRFLADHTV